MRGGSLVGERRRVRDPAPVELFDLALERLWFERDPDHSLVERCTKPATGRRPDHLEIHVAEPDQPALEPRKPGHRQ